MQAIIFNIIGPYDGPFQKNIITYKLRIKSGDLIAWHENGARGFINNARTGDWIDGLELTPERNRPSYKKSKLKLINFQTNLFE